MSPILEASPCLLITSTMGSLPGEAQGKQALRSQCWAWDWGIGESHHVKPVKASRSSDRAHCACHGHLKPPGQALWQVHPDRQEQQFPPLPQHISGGPWRLGLAPCLTQEGFHLHAAPGQTGSPFKELSHRLRGLLTSYTRGE